MNNTLKDRTPQELAERTYRYAKARLHRPGLVDRAIPLVVNASSQIDELRDVVQSRGVEFACRPGCAYCCTLRVDATSPEIFRIARHLKEKGNVEKITRTLAEYSEKVHGLKLQDHYETCVFLSDGLCSIYDHRPASCRKYFSMDVEICKTLDDPVPENAEMRYKSDAILQGLSTAMDESGATGQLHELGQSLYIAITQDDVESRWGRGEVVFPRAPESAR